MAIAGVGSISRALSEGLTREGRAINGGDVAFSLITREASAGGAFVPERGGPALRRRHAPGDGPHGRRAASALVEVKAVDDAYPLAGQAALGEGGDLAGGLAGAEGRRAPSATWRCSPASDVKAGRCPVDRRRRRDIARYARRRAGQAGGRGRLRPPADDVDRGAAVDRADPAGLAGHAGATASLCRLAWSRRPWRNGRRRRFRRPAGRSARVTTPRRSSSAISSASRCS